MTVQTNFIRRQLRALFLAAGLVAAALPAAAQLPHVPDTPENHELLILQETEAIKRILQLVDLKPILVQPHLLPPTIVIQREIIPAITRSHHGRAATLRRGESVPLHEATPDGIILPVRIRKAVNSIPLNPQGRLDSLAIRKMSRNLQPGYGVVPVSATDLVYQLREHLTVPSYVQLTEHAPATLQRQGMELGEIELRKSRELPLVAVQGNALRLKVYNSEVEVPVEWTDFRARQEELNELLQLLRPIPTTPVTRMDDMMRPPEQQETGSRADWEDLADNERLTELQIKAMEQERQLKVRMAADDKEIKELEAKLRLLALQRENLVNPAGIRNDRGPGKASPIKEDEQLQLISKQNRQAMIALAGAYRNAIETRLKAKRGFEAFRYYAKARGHINEKSDSPTLAALSLEQLASLEDRIREHHATYERRKQDFIAMAQRDSLLGGAAYDAILRDYPDLPNGERLVLQKVREEAAWEQARSALWDRMRPIVEAGKTDEAGALARLAKIKLSLSAQDPHYQMLAREVQLARREIRQFHLNAPLPERVKAQAMVEQAQTETGSEVEAPPVIDATLWLRISLLAGLVVSVAVIGGALVFVLQPKRQSEDVSEITKAIPPPPGEEQQPTSRT